MIGVAGWLIQSTNHDHSFFHLFSFCLERPLFITMTSTWLIFLFNRWLHNGMSSYCMFQLTEFFSYQPLNCFLYLMNSIDFYYYFAILLFNFIYCFVLVSYRFVSSADFHSCCRSIHMALTVRNNFGFVDN